MSARFGADWDQKKQKLQVSGCNNFNGGRRVSVLFFCHSRMSLPYFHTFDCEKQL